MLRRTLALTAFLAVAAALPIERTTAPPDVLTLTQVEKAPSITLDWPAIDVVSLLLPTALHAQSAAVDTTARAAPSGNSRKVLWITLFVVVAGVAGVWFYRRSNPNDGPSPSTTASGGSSGGTSRQRPQRPAPA